MGHIRIEDHWPPFPYTNEQNPNTGDKTLYARAQRIHIETEHRRVADRLITQLETGQVAATVVTPLNIGRQLAKRDFRQTSERKQLLATLAAYGVPAEKVRVTFRIRVVGRSYARVVVLP